MATDDTPNRIDQVFADGRLIDEAIAAAAAEAIDRHRRAGTPVVIFRDGRIDHVPADRLALDIETLLREAKFEGEQTAKELIAWFEDRLSAINRYSLAKEAALLHQGRFKRFYEELYPFAIWLGHLYASREDVMCSLNSRSSANRDYDAVVKDRATDPPTVTYVQLTTTTYDRNDSLRMKRLLEDGVAPAWGPSDQVRGFSREEKLKEALDKIERAAGRKSCLSYGPDYVLVVSFDDFMWFGTDDDRAALRLFVSERLAAWRLNVAVLYVVGISGRTFESFPVPRP